MSTRISTKGATARTLETGFLQRMRGAREHDRIRRAFVARPGLRRLTALVCLVAGVHLTARPLVDEPTLIMERASRAQALANEMRAILGIEPMVQVVGVVYHPLVFSVEPVDSIRNEFILSVEFGFLIALDDDELRAAIAHELGHVWIFTHHPFLQTEKLANAIARPLAERSSFERVYLKLWAYEGSPGVPIGNLLGPDPDPEPLPSPGSSP